MIYLPKSQDIKCIGPNENLDTATEPLDKICSLVAAGKISAEQTGHILYSLMEIYIDCEFFYRWLSLPTEKERVKLFYSWADNKKFNEVVSMFSRHFSESRFNLLDAKIKEMLRSDYNEHVNDYTQTLFPQFVKDVKNRIFFKKYFYANLYLNHHLSSMVWSCLRISSDTVCGDGDCYIPDYTDGNLYFINNNQQKETLIANKKDEFGNMAQDCLDEFVKIAAMVTDTNKTGENIKNNTEEILAGIRKVNENVMAVNENVTSHGTEIKKTVDAGVEKITSRLESGSPAGSCSFGNFDALEKDQNYQNLCEKNSSFACCIIYLFNNGLITEKALPRVHMRKRVYILRKDLESSTTRRKPLFLCCNKSVYSEKRLNCNFTHLIYYVIVKNNR